MQTEFRFWCNIEPAFISLANGEMGSIHIIAACGLVEHRVMFLACVEHQQSDKRRNTALVKLQTITGWIRYLIHVLQVFERRGGS